MTDEVGSPNSKPLPFAPSEADTACHFALLAEASDILFSSLDYETTLVRVVQLVLKVLADCCLIYKLEDRGYEDLGYEDSSFNDDCNDGVTEPRENISLLAAIHRDPEKQAALQEVSDLFCSQVQNPKSLTAKVLRTGEPLLVSEASYDLAAAVTDDQRLLAFYQTLDPKSFMILPLSVRGKVLGALILITTVPHRRYGPSHLCLAEELAGRAAIAIDHAQLYWATQQAQQSAERSAERTARLQAVTAALSQSLSPTQVLDVILEQGIATLNANSAMVVMLNEAGTELEIVRSAGYLETEIAQWRYFPLSAQVPLAEAVRTGEIIWTESSQERAARYPHLAEIYARYNYPSWVSLPFVIRGRAVGGLSLTFDEAQPVTEEDKLLLLALAQQCAQAIDRAQLYEVERTARSEAEAARSQIHNILESITDAFVAVDADWRYTYVNSEAARLSRLTAEEMLGQRLWDVFPDLVDSIFYEQYHHAVAENVSVQFEALSPILNLWLAVKAYPFGDGLAIYFQDISDRKQAEAEREKLLDQLEIERSRFEAVLRQMPGGVVIAEATSGQLLLANQQVAKLLGEPIDPTRNFDHHDQYVGFHPDGRPYTPEEWPMTRAIRTGENIPNEDIEIHLKDGRSVTIRCNASPIRDSRGEIVAGVVTFYDITEQKQNEQEREQLLLREQLAREQAEVANRVKDEFLAVLSHELRSPLNAILGWAKLLRSRQYDEPTQSRALETIERNAKHQTQLIEDLLDVSRILRGKLSLNVVPVNLANVIEAAIETVQLAAEAKSITLQIELDPSVGSVAGDASRLQQVVWNLLSNAVKFTPPHGHITIRLQDHNCYAIIQVSDSGKGITTDFLPYIFESFRQADSTTTRMFGGLGLGLAIVRHLVELHGGTVMADSAGEDQGSTFTVKLPLIQNSTDHTKGDLSPLATGNLNGLQILLVDDEADTRDFLEFVLKEFGATVTAVSSAEQALSTLEQFTPDLLLSDIGMPQQDGYTLIRQVRTQLPAPQRDLPAIALTAYATQEDAARAIAAGFQHHLSKPVEPATLIQTISDLMQQPTSTVKITKSDQQTS